MRLSKAAEFLLAPLKASLSLCRTLTCKASGIFIPCTPPPLMREVALAQERALEDCSSHVDGKPPAMFGESLAREMPLSLMTGERLFSRTGRSFLLAAAFIAPFMVLTSLFGERLSLHDERRRRLLFDMSTLGAGFLLPAFVANRAAKRKADFTDGLEKRPVALLLAVAATLLAIGVLTALSPLSVATSPLWAGMAWRRMGRRAVEIALDGDALLARGDVVGAALHYEQARIVAEACVFDGGFHEGEDSELLPLKVACAARFSCLMASLSRNTSEEGGGNPLSEPLARSLNFISDLWRCRHGSLPAFPVGTVDTIMEAASGLHRMSYMRATPLMENPGKGACHDMWGMEMAKAWRRGVRFEQAPLSHEDALSRIVDPMAKSWCGPVAFRNLWFDATLAMARELEDPLASQTVWRAVCSISHEPPEERIGQVVEKSFEKQKEAISCGWLPVETAKSATSI